MNTFMNTFLQRARELGKYSTPGNMDHEADYWLKRGERSSFVQNCWPEIVALVEAAQRTSDINNGECDETCEKAPEPCWAKQLRDTLEALDLKANDV